MVTQHAEQAVREIVQHITFDCSVFYGLSQPALSNHISIVEDTLGLKLFIRTTHQVRLTKEGKLFYEKIK